MGEVAAKIKIMPQGIETDHERLKGDIKAAMPDGAKLYGITEEAIAFGLKALIATVIIDDVEGGTERIEEMFAKLDGVKSIQVIGLGLI
ncbi:MAG: elongation factor 1-beta [Methanosarcinales archaeon Met12]|nr:MAG: elongation factor 1-beta [Methanosarcinales archaeon Met12]